MNVSPEEIRHIAKLADLNLSEEEIQNYTNNMQDILNFANIIKQADTSAVKQESTNVCNVFRKDEVKQSYTREELMQNAEEQAQGMFKIPKVMG